MLKSNRSGWASMADGPVYAIPGPGAAAFIGAAIVAWAIAHAEVDNTLGGDVEAGLIIGMFALVAAGLVVEWIHRPKRT
jgi:hypothetical protein